MEIQDKVDKANVILTDAEAMTRSPDQVPSPLPDETVIINRQIVPSPPGWLYIRNCTTKGQYIGEINVFAVNAEALKAMAKNLLEMAEEAASRVQKLPPGARLPDPNKMRQLFGRK